VFRLVQIPRADTVGVGTVSGCWCIDNLHCSSSCLESVWFWSSTYV